MNPAATVLVLALVWAAITGNFTGLNLLLGVAIGASAKANAARAVALGEMAVSAGDGSLAIGGISAAGGDRSIALGWNSIVFPGADGSMARGANSEVAPGVTNAVALGAGSYADRDNSISVGSPTRIHDGQLPVDIEAINRFTARFGSA